MNQDCKRGIKIGVFCAIVISCIYIHNLIWGNTVFGIEIDGYGLSERKIHSYERFQQLRDPKINEWIMMNTIDKHIIDSIWLERKIIIPNMTSDEVLNWYITILSKNNTFGELKKFENDNMISFKNLSDGIEGHVKIVSENPVVVEISVGGYAE